MRHIHLTSALLLVALGATACGGSEPTPENAVAGCEDHIERDLERDLEARVDLEFDASPEVAMTGTEWVQYEVAGGYDMGNGSGETTHTDYTCVIVKKKTTSGWAVVDLRTTEE
ncbi:hypothetical protein [Nocardiopsis potens]|uniref:hypothetical protein n=1 Tax=Nocardiopsis potens TaxID=1246458 RepID=UPI00034D3EB3|nr:hypothetical protein [Nocardiopsis potens]